MPKSLTISLDMYTCRLSIDRISEYYDRTFYTTTLARKTQRLSARLKLTVAGPSVCPTVGLQGT